MPGIGARSGVGISQTDGDSEVTPERLIAEADLKLYEAKQEGRNRVLS